LPDVPAPSATGSTGSGLTPGAVPTETELAQLPLPPFPGSRVKRFQRQPTWARPGAYTLAVEGAGNAGDVASFYLKRIRQKDASAEAETVTPTYIRLRSTAASATIDVAVAKDGKTITTQIGYGMF
jgi:hypothetical protein